MKMLHKIINEHKEKDATKMSMLYKVERVEIEVSASPLFKFEASIHSPAC